MNDSSSPKGAGKAVRVEDVAREAGVSPITVSRALSAPHKVKAETRARIAEAVKRTGYVVNPIASSLRSGRSTIVMALVANLRNVHYANAVQGAIGAFEGSRFQMLFAQTGYSDMLEPEIVEPLLPFRPAGILFTGLVRNADTRGALRALGVPVVEMWGESDDPVDMLVHASIRDAGRLMGAHFGARGFRHIAYCGRTIARGGERLAGFRDGLAAHGRAVELVVALEGTSSLAEGMQAVDTVRAQLPECDAIFFGTDLLAVGAILRARQLGLAVPRELALAGFGDLDFAGQIEPALTSVSIGDHEVGKRAGELLRQRLEGGAVAEPVIQVPVALTVRASTLREIAAG